MSDTKIILIVEDSRVSRMMTRAMILKKKPDWKIHEASTADEALVMCEKLIPDLITMDVNMPGLNGIEASERLQKTHPQTKICLFTGNIQNSIQEKAKTLGLAFVLKPVTEQSIQEIVSLIDGD